jgi:hypothetical protein
VFTPLTPSIFTDASQGGAQLPVPLPVLRDTLIAVCSAQKMPRIVAVVAAVYFARACRDGPHAVVQLPGIGNADRATEFVAVAHACIWLAARLTLLSLRRSRLTKIQPCNVLISLAQQASGMCKLLGVCSDDAGGSHSALKQLLSIGAQLRACGEWGSQEYYDLQSKAIQRERTLIMGIDLRRDEQDEIMASSALGWPYGCDDGWL